MSRHIEECRRELARVVDLLKGQPDGLSITDISKSLDMNRNSVSKYLNMLVISGRVDMRSVGVSKVYTGQTVYYFCLFETNRGCEYFQIKRDRSRDLDGNAAREEIGSGG